MKKAKDYKTEYGTISLPMPLIDKIKGRIRGSGINSVSSYVTLVLRQIFSFPNKERKILNKEDEKEIKERLRNLGYL